MGKLTSWQASAPAPPGGEDVIPAQPASDRAAIPVAQIAPHAAAVRSPARKQDVIGRPPSSALRLTVFPEVGFSNRIEVVVALVQLVEVLFVLVPDVGRIGRV